MRDYYVFDVTRRQTSRFDSNPYYELDIVGIDPFDRYLKLYKTYVVTVYENYDNWAEIINQASQSGIAVWFSGNMKFKKWEEHMINADSKPHFQDVVPVKKLEAFLQHNINIGAIKNTRPEKELSEIGKQFFEV